MESNETFAGLEREKRRLKSALFGKRFAGATLGDSKLPAQDLIKLKSWVDKPTDFLIMMGSPGVGKTYHCAALYDWWFSKRREIVYVNENDFFREIRGAIRAGNEFSNAVQELASPMMAFFDDLGCTGLPTEWRDAVIFDFFNTRFEDCLPTFITTNLTFKEINEMYGERVASRLSAKGNIIIDLHGFRDQRCS